MIYKLIFDNGYDKEPTGKVQLKKPLPLVGHNEQFLYRKGDEEGKTSNEFNLTLRIIDSDNVEISSQATTFMVGLETHRSNEKEKTNSLNKEAITEYFDQKLSQAEIYGHKIYDGQHRQVKIVWEK